MLGTVPLYRYYNGANHDHFYTINPHEIGTVVPGVTGRHGYTSERIAAYCYPHSSTGMVPLYRYYNGGASDHFYTTNAAEIGTTVPGLLGLHGYRSEGVACRIPH